MLDLQERRGVKHLQVHGKGSKIHFIPLHPGVAAAMDAAGLDDDKEGALFRPVSNNTRGRARSITPGGVSKMPGRYAGILGIDVDGFGPHSLQATAATNALEHGADIVKLQEWLGHANIATTRV